VPGGVPDVTAGKVGHADTISATIGASPHAFRLQKIQNRPYDEAVELEGSLDERCVFLVQVAHFSCALTLQFRSVETNVNMSHSMLQSPPQASKPQHAAAASGGVSGARQRANDGFQDRGDTPPRDLEEQARGEYHGAADISLEGGSPKGKLSEAASPLSDSGIGGAEYDASAGAAVPKATYNAAVYAGLRVSDDIKGLFQYITAYKPHDIKLDTQMKPFVPDYIPSVGDMDAFLKPPRPDGAPDELGLKMLDEPATNQSDATVLDLQLRALSKKSNLKPTHVRSVEDASRNPREVHKWVTSIAELHRSKPAPQVHYTRSMPDVDRLMEAWPAAFDSWLEANQGKAGLPTADIELSLDEMAQVACGLLDVPVYPGNESSLIQSMHALFTVYHEFKTNPHFQQHTGGADEGHLGAAGIGNAYEGKSGW